MTTDELTRAQCELAEHMSGLCEDVHSAGWVNGWASELWEIMQTGAHRCIAPDDMAKLRTLAERAGGWIALGKAQPGRGRMGWVFAPIAEWTAMDGAARQALDEET